MVLLNRIYTRTGDAGETAVGDGSRVSKLHERIVAGGSVDEANTLLGVAVAYCPDKTQIEQLQRLQQLLFDLGADISVPQVADEKEDRCPRMTAGHVKWLEQQIDSVNQKLSPLKSFVLPGGCPHAAALHVARSVCRRAEVDTIRLQATTVLNPQIVIVLNRLSDLLFVLARAANDDGRSDVLWQPGRAIPAEPNT